MSEFFYTGQFWINMENVTNVEVDSDPRTGDPRCRVWFTGGTNRLLEVVDSQELLKFLQARRIKVP